MCCTVLSNPRTPLIVFFSPLQPHSLLCSTPYKSAAACPQAREESSCGARHRSGSVESATSLLSAYSISSMSSILSDKSDPNSPPSSPSRFRIASKSTLAGASVHCLDHQTYFELPGISERRQDVFALHAANFRIHSKIPIARHRLLSGPVKVQPAYVKPRSFVPVYSPKHHLMRGQSQLFKSALKREVASPSKRISKSRRKVRFALPTQL